MNPEQPPSHEQYPQQYPYPQQQPKKSNGVLIAVIVLVALFLLGGAGVVGGYFLLSDDDENDEGSSQSKEEPSQSKEDDDTQDDDKKKAPLPEYSVTTDSGMTFALVGGYEIDGEEAGRTNNTRVALKAPENNDVTGPNQVTMLHYTREGEGERMLGRLQANLKNVLTNHTPYKWERDDVPGYVGGAVYLPTCDITRLSCRNTVGFIFADEDNAVYISAMYMDFDKASAAKDDFDPAEYAQVDNATLAKLKDTDIKVPNAAADTIAAFVIAGTAQFAPVEDDAESSTDSNVPAR